MQSTTEATPISTKRLWAGRIISAIPVLFLLVGGINGLIKTPQVVQGMAKLGYPDHLAPVIGLLELVCITVYVIPRTSVLGAILLTGYMGGATASHVRVSDPTLFAPILFGILVWLGLWLRDDRLRSLIPLRS